MPPPRLRIAGGVAAGVFALVACHNELSVPPPAPDASADRTCRSVVQQLPETVNDQPVRPTSPQSPFTAAWGTPGIVLRCGVGEPAAYDPAAQLIRVNGVDWFPEELTEGYVFTTWGREVNVEVTVPDEYAPEVNPLVDLAPAVKGANPVTP